MKNAYSSVKIFHHKAALDAMEQGKGSAPFYVRIKPTNICNHHCAYCTYGSGDTGNKTENRDSIRHTDMIPRDKMLEMIDDMGNMGVKAVTFSGGGEPLTYPYMKEAAAELKRRNIELSLISNGQLLKGELAEAFYDAKWVRISFDSPNAAEYAKLRGISEKSYEEVVKNISDFARNKNKTCVLGVNFVISKSNYRRVYEAARLLKSLGVNHVKFAAVISNEKKYHESIKDKTLEQIYGAMQELSSGDFQIINSYENECMDKNFSIQPFSTCYTCRLVTVIAADQKLYLCHTRAYDSDAVLSDLRETSFREAWYAEETQKKLAGFNPRRECKNFCVYEERNQLIQAYFDVNYDHINFI